MPRLQDELKKRRPFDSLEQEAFLGILRTCSVLNEAADELLTASASPPPNTTSCAFSAAPAP